jgi:glutathionyl-hydroquinone reductase
VLWDKKNRTIVNNESSEIIRIFNTAFNHLLPEDKAAVDLYPEALRKEIDAINEWTYPKFNSQYQHLLMMTLSNTSRQCRVADGVYRTGFATSETAYQAAVKEVFEALDRLEAILTENQKKGEHYLVGGVLTEADVRVYVTAIRFDPVYFGHFKCNIRSIRADYPAIHKYVFFRSMQVFF